MSLQVALFAGAVVLLTAGFVGLPRRSLGPRQALGVLAVAAGVAAISGLASLFPSTFVVVVVVASVTIAGALMAVLILGGQKSPRHRS